MSWIQRFFIKILPSHWAKSMEADSRSWFIQCPKCNFEESYWEIGGIPRKAKGNQRNFRKCLKCGEKSWHRRYKKDSH